MRTTKKQRVRFHNTPLYKKREPHVLAVVAQKSSFWIATFSLFAFVVGNMVGQHGWYVVWKSVFGADADIMYAGTTPPIEQVPDYVAWARYGGTPSEHTFRQVPADVLVPLPPYNPATQSDHMAQSSIGQIYSVGFAGSYEHEGDNEGSHPGIDIRVPEGTPVVAIANGIVEEVKYDPGGFGNVVVVRHPNVPDPDRPTRTTTLYSNYAHLSTALVTEGSIVHKGERIALSGKTGMVSGAHLHFQIDRDDAPWHPYWPFTGSESRAVGLNTWQAVNAGLHKERIYEYSVHPMLYVQANYSAPTVIADAREDAGHTAAPAPDPTLTLNERVQKRLEERLSRQRFSDRVVQQTTPSAPTVVSRETVVSAALDEPTTVETDTAVPAPAPAAVPVASGPQPVATIEIRHDGSFTGRGWEDVTVTVFDESGNKIADPDVARGLYLRTAYGEAEFRPSVLRNDDFHNGEATVKMLPRGRRTVVIQVWPQGVTSDPMQYRD